MARPKTRDVTSVLFPDGFLWGSATSAYQIEGGANDDGKGSSVWDVFCRRPGSVFEKQTGDVACDHYHRYQEDLALIESLGGDGYRFSISWPRVVPAGIGAINQQGLDFYDRLVDSLLEAGVIPMVTLFHWDFPFELYREGGWLNRDVARWFADYAAVVAGRLSDRVRLWTTLNEPQAFLGLGHLEGVHAPGDKMTWPAYLQAAHNSLRAHGAAVDALRRTCKTPPEIGYVTSVYATRPAEEQDVEAARRAMFAAQRHQWTNTWWLDPVMLGSYPADGVKIHGADMPSFPIDDLEDIAQPIDFLGLNIYTATTIRTGPDGEPEKVAAPPGYPRSGVDWQPLVPDCLYWGPRYLWERYHIPAYITENGIATRDHVSLDGRVHDPQRVDYMHRALLDLARVISDGVPVLGYFTWSLLDNFEWAEGYKQRFGITYVDFVSMARIPKDSYYFYQQVIASRGANLVGAHITQARHLYGLGQRG